MKVFLHCIVVGSLVLMPQSCKNEIRKLMAKGNDTSVFTIRGTVVSLDTNNRSLRLAHGRISTYSDEGTTSFKVRHPYLFAGLTSGMDVEGTLVVSPSESWLESLSIVQGEPKRGKITTLTFFDDDHNPLITMGWYSIDVLRTTDSLARIGRRSLVGRWGPHAGVQLNMTHKDTSVFWFQENSRLQFWTRSSASDNRMYISATPLGGSHFWIAQHFDPGPDARPNAWYFVDIPIPKELRGIPFSGIVIGGPGVTHTRLLDDVKLTSVRLYAGPGEPATASLDYLAASQIGYAPKMRKQFTSPFPFDSFTIVRMSDGKKVYTGGPAVRTVKSDVLGVPPPTVYIGDFTNFTTPGRYKIVTDKKESLPFTIGNDIFDAPLVAVQRMLYYQRAFTAIEEPYAERHWTHPSDADKAPPGVVKGWHDAGDLSVYMPTMCQTIYWLLEAYNDFRPTEDNTNIPESGNGIPDLLDETRWGLEWVLSMQDDSRNHSGGFWAMACVGCTNRDRGYGKTTPNNVDSYCKVHRPTVQNTAKAVAVLAYASVIFAPFDKKFAATCLTAARNGWEWMQRNPNATDDSGPGCTAYIQGNDQALLRTNRSWAHASLFYATQEQRYNEAFLRDYTPTDWISSYSKTEGFANRTYLRASGGDASVKQQIRQQIFTLADGVRNDADNHAFQYATYYYWGCNGNAMHRTGQFSWAALLLDSSRTADRDAGFDNLHYIFGRNALNICYVSGAYRWGATRYRKEGFHHWMKALNNPDSLFHYPGALAGGPNEAPDNNDRSYPTSNVWGYFGDTRGASGGRISNIRDARTPLDARFTDNDSWSTNEICINWNAAFLYNLYAARAAARRLQ